MRPPGVISTESLKTFHHPPRYGKIMTGTAGADGALVSPPVFKTVREARDVSGGFDSHTFPPKIMKVKRRNLSDSGVFLSPEGYKFSGVRGWDRLIPGKPSLHQSQIQVLRHSDLSGDFEAMLSLILFHRLLQISPKNTVTLPPVISGGAEPVLNQHDQRSPISPDQSFQFPVLPAQNRTLDPDQCTYRDPIKNFFYIRVEHPDTAVAGIVTDGSGPVGPVNSLLPPRDIQPEPPRPETAAPIS